MLSETLTDGLEQYEIGSKVRQLRLNKGMALAQLSEHSGLSTAMLSKIERGQIFPTLPTLLRIAMVFGVGLDHFFANDANQPVMAITRKGERMRFPEQQGSEDETYFFESLNFPATDSKINGYLANFSMNSHPSEPHAHEGVEMIFVLSGELAVDVGGNLQVLSEGDAIYFESTTPHTYARSGDQPCSALIIVTAEQ
ncbi:XRE family transcriptional regulator [Hyphococcus flavus]|uniref:XRE family transcriptional regulator n=1 Tax=Hyphococcus flavus TaxID=1866326 RepID=A0AAE9ZFM3_9PROT|nr:XRE family transcriptional regulator [Hyphococcus flavus]WDI32945.1 XRE family transcriptional regulator [Hyphococcus flavus]